MATRREDARPGLLGLLGADAKGQQALVGLWAGSRARAPSWKALLLALHSRGVAPGPTWAMGDGARGLWKARRQGEGPTRGPRCGVQQTANVLDTLPHDLQPQANQRLPAIWMAPDRQRATLALDVCMATYEAQEPKAAACLAQAREA